MKVCSKCKLPILIEYRKHQKAVDRVLLAAKRWRSFSSNGKTMRDVVKNAQALVLAVDALNELESPK